jgi:hypothetical protein
VLPLATTTIDITRVAHDATRDGYDPRPNPTTVARNVRAVIGSPSGRQNISAGDRTVVTWSLRADPCDLTADDTVTDNTTGDTYRVIWARQRYELGLGYTAAGLEQVAGAST